MQSNVAGQQGANLMGSGAAPRALDNLAGLSANLRRAAPARACGEKSHGSCLDLPYPQPCACRPNPEYVCVVRSLFAGCNSELSASLQYIHDSLQFACLHEDLRRLFLDLAICEMHHLDLLGRLIVSLGGQPCYCSCDRNNAASPDGWWTAQPPVIRYLCDAGLAIMENIAAERRAIADYRSAMCSIDDPNVCTLFRRIIMDEERHIELLSEAFCRFCS